MDSLPRRAQLQAREEEALAEKAQAQAAEERPSQRLEPEAEASAKPQHSRVSDEAPLLVAAVPPAFSARAARHRLLAT